MHPETAILGHGHIPLGRCNYCSEVVSSGQCSLPSASKRLAGTATTCLSCKWHFIALVERIISQGNQAQCQREAFVRTNMHGHEGLRGEVRVKSPKAGLCVRRALWWLVYRLEYGSINSYGFLDCWSDHSVSPIAAGNVLRAVVLL